MNGCPMNSKIHYSGGLRIVNRWSGVTELFAGYPCCCYGGRAEKIARDGNQSIKDTDVTCVTCKKYIDQARANGVVGTGDHTRVTLGSLKKLVGS